VLNEQGQVTRGTVILTLIPLVTEQKLALWTVHSLISRAAPNQDEVWFYAWTMSSRKAFL
jgi:hypothetical protein